MSILLPDTNVTRAALEHVRRVEEPAIFHHSVRVFLYAQAAAAAAAEEEIDVEGLFVACLFHDVGTAPENDGSQRFEVEGADAAVRFLRRHNWARPREDEVWEAIALHTSSGIAERRGAVARYTRLGVRADFGDTGIVSRDFITAIEAEYPRLDIERVLGAAVVQQTLTRPEKAPANSWPGRLRAAHLADPQHEGVNPAF